MVGSNDLKMRTLPGSFVPVVSRRIMVKLKYFIVLIVVEIILNLVEIVTDNVYSYIRKRFY